MHISRFRGLIGVMKVVPSALFQCTLANDDKGKSTLWHHCQQQRTVAAWRVVDCRPAVKAGSGVLSLVRISRTGYILLRAFLQLQHSVRLGVGVLVIHSCPSVARSALLCYALRFLMAEKLLMIRTVSARRVG